MRILTVRQPWAYAIMHLGKDVENRSRNIAGDYRGPVAIHAAKTGADYWFDTGGAGDQIARLAGFWPGIVQCPPGAIIGVVDLVDVHHADECDECFGDDAIYSVRTHCSVWGHDECHHIALADPCPLTSPLTRWADSTPIRGALGLRKLTKEQEQWITEHVEAS